MEDYTYYTLYLAEDCPYCVSALDLARSSGVEYYAQFLEWESPILLEAKEKYNHSTVPVVIETRVTNGESNERLIGGYTEFAAHLEE
tara:strand:- start:161 stop:421 length:261 start_codon:yes stop_codon:yes gene_type:complete